MCFCLKKNKTKIIPENAIVPIIKQELIDKNKENNIKINSSIVKQCNMFNFIGNGYTSNVYKCYHRKQIYACKLITRKHKVMALNEIKVLKQIPDNEYICKYYDTLIKVDKIYILTEFCQGNELFYILKKNMGINRILKIVYQISLGVKALHENNIFHLDLKLENIMINYKDEIKIIDFGLSKIMNSKLNNKQKYKKVKTITGTIGYLAPEIINQQIVHERTDIWNIGIILWMLLTEVPPFTIIPSHLYYKEISNLKKYSPFITKNFYKMNKNLDNEQFHIFYDVLINLLCEDYKRYNINKLLQHRIFDEIKK